MKPKIERIKQPDYKIYGNDLGFVRIYETIKMGLPISTQDRDYFLEQKPFYTYDKELSKVLPKFLEEMER